MTRRLLAAISCAAIALPLTAGIAAAAPAMPSDQDSALVVERANRLPAAANPLSKVGDPLVTASGIVTAFIELDAPSGVETADAGGGTAAVEAAADDVETLADEVVSDDSARRSTAGTPVVVSVTSDLVAGVIVTGDAGQIRAMAADPKVVGVHLMTPKKPLNKGTDAFTGALAAWQATGQTGAGVRVGIIDTGLDYTHADFGGPGTREAYATAYGADGTGPVPDGSHDPAKYLGGWDFAGPTYDAGSTDAAANVPHPDANPIDGADGASGHGSHVAGTTAGYGVQADGTTFTGDYATLTDISDWQIGPGSAPGAGLYALKVFGDAEGSTNLTIDALEWSADPNGDGDYSDHLDVINLSLGSDASPADDPDNLFIDALADLGVLSVIASGNAGDITDIGGTPGNARSALTVANSVGNTQTVDAVEVTAATDESLLGQHSAQNSINYTGADVTAPVAYLDATVDGCSPLTDVAEQIAGKVVWLFWDDDTNTRACGSTARWTNASDAGAVGVLIGTTDPVFSYGISGNDVIPGAMLTAASQTALMPEIIAGTLSVHVGPSLANTSFISIPDLADTLNSSSSRGVHGSLGIVKPDVAAPGTGISSASSGTGNGRSTKSGTSMSTPHVAGIAALVVAAHPEWSAQQVKADVMNTATHDVTVGENGSGAAYGPERVGSGRVDAEAATTNTVLAFATDDPALVSVTFGVVPVGAKTVTVRKTVTVTNTGSSTQRLATSFVQSTSAGGAEISVSPSRITVPAGKSRTVKVTLRADPATLAKELDPTSVDSYFGGGAPRDFVSSVSGRLVLTAGDGSALRVPVQAAPRLVSDMSAEPVSVAPGESSAPLTLTGRGVDSGGWTSLVAPFDLVATSPRLDKSASTGASPSVIASGDLRYVGFSSTAPQIAAAGLDPNVVGHGTIGIGIAVDGEWATLGTNTIPVIDIDIDQDGTPDLETLIWKYSADTDLTVVETYEIVESGGGLALGDLLDLSPANGLWADVDTSVFDSNVVVAPINLDAVGISDEDTPSFEVYTVSSYASDPSGVLDAVEPFTADPYAPTTWFDAGVADALWYVDDPSTAVTAHRADGAGDGQLLLLHTHNAVGARAQVVDVTAPAATATTTALRVTGGHSAGRTQTLRAAVTPSEAAGSVRFLDGTTELGTATVRRGAARLQVKLPEGEHSLTAEFLPASAAYLGSVSAPVPWTVAPKAASTTTAYAPPVVSSRSTSWVTALVRSSERPTGTITVSEDGTELGTAQLIPLGRSGFAIIGLPRLAVGSHMLTVAYSGNAVVAPSETTVKVRAASVGRS